MVAGAFGVATAIREVVVNHNGEHASSWLVGWNRGEGQLKVSCSS